MDNTTNCGDCGMPVGADDFHPFGACLMFKACKNSETVRANMDFMRDYFAADLTAQLSAAVSACDMARLEAMTLQKERDELRAEVARLKDEMVEACDSHCRRELCVMQREIDAAESRLTALRLHYSEAIEDIEEWGGYASSYFQNKHDLEGAVANHRAALAKSGEPL